MDSRNLVRGQGHSDPRICDTQPSQDQSTQYFGFLLQIKIEICSGHDYSRNEVIGQGHSDPKWRTTLRHPKMQPNTKLGIPTSQNIGAMHQTRCKFPETRSEVKVNVTMT